MNIELKNISMRGGSDGVAFTCDVYIDGARAGEAEKGFV